jgi:hypothetical protein
MDRLKKIKEKDIVKRCLEYLNSLPKTWAFRIENRPGMSRGVSDILVCHRGKFSAIEVKIPGNCPTALQNRFLEKVRDAKGMGIWIQSVEELKQHIK